VALPTACSAFLICAEGPVLLLQLDVPSAFTVGSAIEKP
jgi:hypothetical protein